MKVTEEGLALIRRFEGFRGTAYRCPAGVWTIGHGHTSQAGPPLVHAGLVIGAEEAARILAADVARVAEAVRPLLARPVSDAQFSALVSFAFNVGVDAFRRSSVRRAVNAGRFSEVPATLKLWVKAKGRVLPGLERRRAAEAELFLSDAPPVAGRGDTGAPKPAIAVPPLGGAVAGGAAAAAAASLLPGWAVLGLVVLSLLAAGAVVLWRRRREVA